jgi:hypothetical protein
MEWVVVLLAIAAVVLLVRSLGRRRTDRPLGRSERAAELTAAKRAAEEDVTRFGEELRRLDTDVSMALVDDAMRQDWQRALDAYESADRSLQLAAGPDDIRHVTAALEDGRYAVACVLARKDGKPLPQRRPPCFFNPAHGPSMTDVEWAPPGGQPRQIPVCAADADRVAQGAEPDVRTVPQGVGRVPYWQAGPPYSPWASGYFGAYAGSGLLPGFLVGTLLADSWDGHYVDGFDTGQVPDGYGADGGYDGSGDGGDGSGDGGDGGDSGDGGYDAADSGDGGGYDGGFDGGDFGGGGFDGGGFDGGGF